MILNLCVLEMKLNIFPYCLGEVDNYFNHDIATSTE